MDVAIDLSGTTLETDRLFLRPWEPADLDDFYAYASVPGVGEMAGWPHHESPALSKRILDSFIAGKDVFAVVLRETGRVVGSLGIHGSWANGDPAYVSLTQKEIGYVLSKEQWGKGLMTEAVQAVIWFCFDTLGLDAVTIGHFSTNNQSRRVIEKCGFRFVREGVFFSQQMDRQFEDRKYILMNPTRCKAGIDTSPV